MPVKGSIIPPNVQSFQASQTHTYKESTYLLRRGTFHPLSSSVKGNAQTGAGSLPEK